MLIKKRLRPGRLTTVAKRGWIKVDVDFDGRRLSIQGEIGGEADGRIILEFKEFDDRGSSSLDEIAPYEGWDPDQIRRLFEVWKRWHLNNMRAGCEHQRAEGWDSRPIDPSKPLTAYGRHCEGKSAATWNMLTWVKRDEHPDGLLARPCPVCGHKYGSAWLFEEVPEDVLNFLDSLPGEPIKDEANPRWRRS